MTPTEFQKLFRDMVVAFQPRPLGPTALGTYYDALKAYPLDVVAHTARLIVRTHRFFPSVSEWVIPTKELAARRQHAKHQLVCPSCRGRGLIKITYRSGEPFDVAICGCLGGLAYRQADPNLIRWQLKLSEDARIAYLEDFEDSEKLES
jgi:hypothetical protein